MITATEIMNKIAVERELNQSKSVKQTNVADCCSELQEQLNLTTKRCTEFQDMITNLEEDNIAKAKATMDAIKTLDDFKIGENGLEQLIKKNAELHDKVQSREKHIRSLVNELNGLQHTAEENCILR